jgi:hypothetical protein
MAEHDPFRGCRGFATTYIVSFWCGDALQLDRHSTNPIVSPSRTCGTSLWIFATGQRSRASASSGQAASIASALQRLSPLFLFNQFGDLERCMLRPGNVHGADGWRAVL